MLMADLEIACEEGDYQTAFYILDQLEGSSCFDEAVDMIEQYFPAEN